jgi:uncharacterized protein YuzE
MIYVNIKKRFDVYIVLYLGGERVLFEDMFIEIDINSKIKSIKIEHENHYFSMTSFVCNLGVELYRDSSSFKQVDHSGALVKDEMLIMANSVLKKISG